MYFNWLQTGIDNLYILIFTQMRGLRNLHTKFVLRSKNKFGFFEGPSPIARNCASYIRTAIDVREDRAFDPLNN